MILTRFGDSSSGNDRVRKISYLYTDASQTRHGPGRDSRTVSTLVLLVPGTKIPRTMGPLSAPNPLLLGRYFPRSLPERLVPRSLVLKLPSSPGTPVDSLLRRSMSLTLRDLGHVRQTCSNRNSTEGTPTGDGGREGVVEWTVVWSD